MIDLTNYTSEQQEEILEIEHNNVLDEILLEIAKEVAEKD